MSEGTVVIKIDRYGRPTIDGVGFSGTSCNTAMQAFEDALIGKGAIREDKPELYEENVQENQIGY